MLIGPLRVGILDGYVDEPANFGVPPYIGPQVRYLFGAAHESQAEVAYATIDQYRRDEEARSRLKRSDVLVVYASALVPGKYLRGDPIQFEEALDVAKKNAGKVVLAGGCAVYGFSQGGGLRPQSRNQLKPYLLGLSTLDSDAWLWDYLHGRFAANEAADAVYEQYDHTPPPSAFVESGGRLLLRVRDAQGLPLQRRRTLPEWERFAFAGADAVLQHPDHPHPLIAELETYTGCVRYVNGGCRFCMEPREGKPQWRNEDGIAREAGRLHELGVRNFRLGGQTCFWCYKTTDLGNGDRPRPNPAAIERLLASVRDAAPNLRVLHIDNANPAVIATWPEESREICQSIVRHCTPGNVAAFGLESVDDAVATQNNLNASPEEVRQAVRLLNEEGAQRGENGLPHLLPGLNFISGLDGERAETNAQNVAFLKSLYDEGLMLRRINLRQLLPITGGLKPLDAKGQRRFKEFKRRVRHDVDTPMLRRLVPVGTLLRDVWLEAREGNVTFGRHIGSYPLLVGVPYRLPLEAFTDVVVTSHGQRSVTGYHVPFDVNTATRKMFEALPEIGKSRAASAVSGQPYNSMQRFVEHLGMQHSEAQAYLGGHFAYHEP